ncbi:hypothetical protein NPIL_29301 [Nephila pilipes]|uniref:Uncharacterized protein n=1 Tax=Nephila pilipes TaxID=299642 RepID=A0A8X6MRM2_NEPPI|nr:hypothetical protein NPIL_29301 [Nephila pilipes]
MLRAKLEISENPKAGSYGVRDARMKVTKGLRKRAAKQDPKGLSFLWQFRGTPPILQQTDWEFKGSSFVALQITSRIQRWSSAGFPGLNPLAAGWFCTSGASHGSNSPIEYFSTGGEVMYGKSYGTSVPRCL